jgi:hypothetical protein
LVNETRTFQIALLFTNGLQIYSWGGKIRYIGKNLKRKTARNIFVCKQQELTRWLNYQKVKSTKLKNTTIEN